MKNLTAAIADFFQNRRNLFILGFVLTSALTLVEVMRVTQCNFFTYQLSTFDFWRGIDPYGLDKYDFIYGPLFSILFAPFAWMGATVGPFVWNLFNFTLYFVAIFTLPDKYTEKQKCRTYLYTMLILATTQFSMQFNPVVAYIFVFAFSLLERGRGLWAVLLILVSGLIKVYGIFELALLACYPQVWRNATFAAVMGAALLVLPIFWTGAEGLVPHYRRWIEMLSGHVDQFRFYSAFNIHLWHNTLTAHMVAVQLGSLAALGTLFFINWRKFGDFAFRAGALGTVMGWVILFSLSTEKHTYVIALLGFMVWYWVQPRRGWLLQTLFWSNFILLVVVPVDLLCPPPVMRYLCNTLQLNIWSFIITWLVMIHATFLREILPQNNFQNDYSRTD